MAEDKIENEVASLLRDMNGNVLRKGDLVLVMLEKPILVGFIADIKEPSILTNRDKNPVGVVTVQGSVRLPFKPNQVQILAQTAKLVDPRAESFVNALAQQVKQGAKQKEEAIDLDALAKNVLGVTKKSEVEENKLDPTLVSPSSTENAAPEVKEG
jgi:hypothetical protein